MSYLRVNVCSSEKMRCGINFSQLYTSNALFISSVPIHPRRLRSSPLLFWWSTHTMQHFWLVARCISSSTTSCASTPSLMSFTKSRMPSTITRSGLHLVTASHNSLRRSFHATPRTLKMSNNFPPPSAILITLFLRMSCVDSSLCSVSYHSSRSGDSGSRWNDSTSLTWQHAISIEVTNVLPDFALPVMATSSRRGKHGLPNSRNRKSIFGNSFSGVILNCSSNSICGLSAVSSPACSSSASNWLITFSFITSFAC